MYIAHTVPGCYTLKPLSLVLYLEEEEEFTSRYVMDIFYLSFFFLIPVFRYTSINENKL